MKRFERLMYHSIQSPAIAFHPTRARKELYGAKAKFRFGKVDLPAFKSVDELAFATVPQLAELIRTRKSFLHRTYEDVPRAVKALWTKASLYRDFH